MYIDFFQDEELTFSTFCTGEHGERDHVEHEIFQTFSNGILVAFGKFSYPYMQGDRTFDQFMNEGGFVPRISRERERAFSVILKL